MNPVKQLWCRAVQTVLRLPIPPLPYRRPETLPNVVAVPGILKRHGCARILLATGPNVTRRGLTHALLDALKEAGIHCAVYDKTPPNPIATTGMDALTHAAAAYIGRSTAKEVHPPLLHPPPAGRGRAGSTL